MFMPILIFFAGAVTGLIIVRTTKDKDQKYARLFYLFTAGGLLYGSYACWLNWKYPLVGIGIGISIAVFAVFIGFVVRKFKI